jgi:hypothetical protein
MPRRSIPKWARPAFKPIAPGRWCHQQQVKGPGDISAADASVALYGKGHKLHEDSLRQMAGYAAAIGIKRGLLPEDLRDWRAAWRSEEEVCFELVDCYWREYGRRLTDDEWTDHYLNRSSRYYSMPERVEEVVFAVLVPMSYDALHRWPPEPIEEVLIGPRNLFAADASEDHGAYQ